MDVGADAPGSPWRNEYFSPEGFRSGAGLRAAVPGEKGSMNESAPINHMRKVEPFRRPAPPQPDLGPDPPDGFVHVRAAVA